MIQWLSRKLAAHARPGTIHRWLNRMEGAHAEKLRHHFAAACFHRYLKSTIGHFMQEDGPGPMPPEDLIMRTFVLDEQDAQKKLNTEIYFTTGYRHMLWWLQTAERHGFNLRTAGAILEFGAGTGRLIRHLRSITGVRLVGTDLYPPNVAWCRENLRGIEFYENGEHPPLSFANDETFDLVYAASVFTHIPLTSQKEWLLELRRILKPRGFLLCDVLGQYHQRTMLDHEKIRQLKENGFLVLNHDDDRSSLSTKLIHSWDVFQTRSEILNTFGQVFQVCDFIPARLDLLVLRKPDTIDQAHTTRDVHSGPYPPLAS